MPFPFSTRGDSSGAAKDIELSLYIPSLQLSDLQIGVDNVRHDVHLSPKFAETARQQIARLIVQHGNIKEIASVEMARSAGVPAWKQIASKPQSSEQQEAAEFKGQLSDFMARSLHTARERGNISLDMLARLGLLKFLRSELQLQFAQALERCRIKLRSYDGPNSSDTHRTHELRDVFAKFQINKRSILRKAGQEIFTALRTVEKETIARTRRAFYGDTHEAAYELFLNRLLFTEDGYDDQLNAEQYVLLGTADQDRDRFTTIQELCCRFLRTIAPDLDDAGRDAALSVPENCYALFGTGSSDNERTKAQRALLSDWVSLLSAEGTIDSVAAAYEAAAIVGAYAPVVHPQQLKNALTSKAERKRVEQLLEGAQISLDQLDSAVRRVGQCRGGERDKIAARFLLDFMRYHRDLRRFSATISAMDGVNLLTNEKLRELSKINSTLYEFLLESEERPAEKKIIRHVIIKADVRQSTLLTRKLFEAGLNPASYFSLNFFDPINRLLAKYEAEKVFIEGDAVILSLFQREGDPVLAVSRACVLAKEIVGIVHAYNQISAKDGLPPIEIGIGIAAQEGAPLFLMDGNHRIMISSALNLSDRLSSCAKIARKLQASPSPFRVFVWKPQDLGDDEQGNAVGYNIAGVRLGVEAFEALRNEIALTEFDCALDCPWEAGALRTLHGLVPVAAGSFHTLAVRASKMCDLDAAASGTVKPTELDYYEVCTDERIYAPLEKKQAAKA